MVGSRSRLTRRLGTDTALRFASNPWPVQAQCRRRRASLRRGFRSGESTTASVSVGCCRSSRPTDAGVLPRGRGSAPTGSSEWLMSPGPRSRNADDCARSGLFEQPRAERGGSARAGPGIFTIGGTFSGQTANWTFCVIIRAATSCRSAALGFLFGRENDALKTVRSSSAPRLTRPSTTACRSPATSAQAHEPSATARMRSPASDLAAARSSTTTVDDAISDDRTSRRSGRYEPTRLQWEPADNDDSVSTATATTCRCTPRRGRSGTDQRGRRAEPLRCRVRPNASPQYAQCPADRCRTPPSAGSRHGRGEV